MSGDNIKVVIKVRPLIAREKNENVSKEWQIDDVGQLQSVNRNHKFAFGEFLALLKPIYSHFAKFLLKHEKQWGGVSEKAIVIVSRKENNLPFSPRSRI
jgi:hypothetical protein